MNAIRKNRLPWILRRTPLLFASALFVAAPLAVARADDDWKDRWEDYQEALEDEREDAEERWEDRQEAMEEWREDRREALEDLREDGYYVPRRGWQRDYGPDVEYRVLPPPSRRHYSFHPGPVYRNYYWERPREYRYYRPYPRHRYYGTGGIGYSEYGRHRSVRVGPVQVHWDR